MIVFHGSYTKIKEIDLLKAEVAKDFGKGFYVTKIREDAERMAVRQGEKNQCAGFVSGFKFNHDKAFLNGLYKTERFDGYTLEWLDFIIMNRKNYSDIQAHEFDIVEGPIADDKVTQKVEELSDVPSDAEKIQLLKDLKYRHTHQICFCTAVSLDTIKRIDLAPYADVKKIGNSIITHLINKDNISKEDAWKLYFKSETYKKVSDENTGLYNKVWQEIYDMLKKEIE